ncbi:MAG: hypothetical protein V7L22_03725 [Nostoc sp.]|uniref:hypothetical protein n=1 Tax=Nostoc sp. TaxID=1180 RepID=UPI002FFB94B8
MLWIFNCLTSLNGWAIGFYISLLSTANPATLRLTGEDSCKRNIQHGWKLSTVTLRRYDLWVNAVVGYRLSVSPSRSLVFAQCWQAAISAWFGVGFVSLVTHHSALAGLLMPQWR